MKKFKDLKEFNHYLNNDSFNEIISKIQVDTLEIEIGGEFDDENHLAYLIFKDQVGYFDYIKNNEYLAKLGNINTILKDVSMEEFDTIKKLEKIKYIEFIDAKEKSYDLSGDNVDLPSSWAYDYANIDLAHEKGYTGKGVKILIIDSDFTNKPNELEFQEIINGRTPANATSGHGNGVAAIIGNKSGTSTKGVAPDALLYGYAKEGTSLNIFEPLALNYALDNDMDIVNMSYMSPGGTLLETTQLLFTALHNKGVICLASMGNFGKLSALDPPFGYNHVNAVGGCTIDDNGNLIDGPKNYSGNNQKTEFLHAYRGYVSVRDGIVNTGGYGTSYATPAIAGMFALLKEEFPTATKQELINLMKISGEKVEGLYGVFPVYGNHTETSIIMRPDGYNYGLKVYPITTADNVKERLNKNFVSDDEKIRLNELIESHIIAFVEHSEDIDILRPENEPIVIWYGSVKPNNALNNDILITPEGIQIKANGLWVLLTDIAKGLNPLHIKILNDQLLGWSTGLTTAAGMFKGSTEPEIDLTYFKTENITNMASMFENAYTGVLDLRRFNMDKVTNIASIFNKSTIKTLNLKNVKLPETLNFNGWNQNAFVNATIDNFIAPTFKVISSNFFVQYQDFETKLIAGLKTNNPLQLHMWDTKQLTSLAGLFQRVETPELDLSMWDLNSLNNLGSSFQKAIIPRIDLSSIDTSLITSANYRCFLQSNVGNVWAYARTQTDADYLNSRMETGQQDRFTVFDENSYPLAEDVDFLLEDGLFKYIGTKEYIKIPTMIQGTVLTSCEKMFENNDIIKGVILAHNQITNMSYMFSGIKTNKLSLKIFNTENVTTMHSMFKNSNPLFLDLRGFNLANVVFTTYMFYRAQAQKVLMPTSEVLALNDMDYMFSDTQMPIIDLSGIDFTLKAIQKKNTIFQVSNSGFEYKFPLTVYAKNQANVDWFMARPNRPTGFTAVIKPI